MDQNWNLHYARWVIDDGEPELHVGEEFEWFTVGCWSDVQLRDSGESTKGAVALPDGRYRVNAEVIYVSQEEPLRASIIDFGLKAEDDGANLLPQGCIAGSYVSGEIRLELPLCGAPHGHNLSHRWLVHSVSADLTPFVLSSGGGVYVRDT